MTEMQRRFGRVPNRDKYPCVDFPDGKCPRRRPGCQNKCPEFLRAKAENDARKDIERKKRDATMDVCEYRSAMYGKCTRTKRREK